jgi:hypothetical protein
VVASGGAMVAGLPWCEISTHSEKFGARTVGSSYDVST